MFCSVWQQTNFEMTNSYTENDIFCWPVTLDLKALGHEVQNHIIRCISVSLTDSVRTIKMGHSCS